MRFINPEKICTIIEKYSRCFVAIFFGGFLVVFSALSLLYTTYYDKGYSEVPLYRHDSVYLVLFAFFSFLFIMYLFDKYRGLERLDTKILLKVLRIYVFAVAVFWIFVSKSYPVDDADTVSKIASAFLKKDYSALAKGNYLYIYPFQLGIVSLLQVIYSIFGANSYQVFQLINGLFVVLAFHALCKITEIAFCSKKTTNILILLLFGCFPPIMYSVFVYGNIISMSLSLVAVWMLLQYFRTEKVIFFAVSAGAITVAILLKNNSLIVLVAMCILLVLRFLKTLKIKLIVFVPILLLLNIFSSNSLFGYYQTVTNKPINEGAPKILWVAMGLQEGARAPGWYNGFSLFPYIDNQFDEKKTAEQAQSAIKESLTKFKAEPKYAAKFMYHKFVSQWNDPTYQSFWTTRCYRSNEAKMSKLGKSLCYGKLNKVSLMFMNSYHFIIVFLALLFILCRKFKLNLEQTALLLIIIGGFLFHMIWEAKGQYIFPYFLMLVPYAAAGTTTILSLTHEFVESRNTHRLKSR